MNKLIGIFVTLTLMTFFPAVMLPLSIHTAVVGGMSLGFDVATMILIIYSMFKRPGE